MTGMTDDSASKHPPIGPVGERVIDNVEKLRQARGISFRDLAARLAKLGRPIGPAVLHRLSQGKRRVDADDLVALAVALGVNPSTLLLPHTSQRDDVVDLAPNLQQRAWISWEWADGRMYMPGHLIDDSARVELNAATMADFVEHARPDLMRRRDHPAVLAAEQVIVRLLQALMDMEGNEADGDKREWWRNYVTRSMQRLQVEADDLFSGGPSAAPVLPYDVLTGGPFAAKREQDEGGADARL